jgi:hypothetical protein
MLRDQFKPASIDYYGGIRTWEFQASSELFEWSYPFHGAPPSDLAGIASSRRGYDLVVNVEKETPAKIFAGALCTEDSFICGPCGDMPGHDLPFPDDLPGQLWMDPNWMAEDITERFPILSSGFIGEILCRASYLRGPIPAYRVPCEEPSRPIPPILISTAGTIPEKLWPAENWLEMLSFFEAKGLEVGLLGAHPLQQKQFWKGNDGEEILVRSGLVKDLRGKLTLPEVVGALKGCRFVLTLDNGILHLAVAMKKPTVGIYRYGIDRLWAPPSDSLTVLTPAKDHSVSDIGVDVVKEAVSRAF